MRKTPGPAQSGACAAHRSRARWIPLGEAILGSLIVFGYNVWRLPMMPNSVFLLVAMALVSFRLREGRWTAGLEWPKSWPRTVLIAIAAMIVQQAIGQFVVDPLTHPFLRYSTEANPMAGLHGSVGILRWLGVIWTYAAFGEEIGYRGYLLRRVADFGGNSRLALFAGLLWSSAIFGFAHWYQGPAGVVAIAVSGFVYGAAYLLSGKNLWVAVCAHGFSDTVALAVTCLGVAG